MSVKPKGFNYVSTMMCGSCSVEGSYKLAFMALARKLRGGKTFTQKDLDSCMCNEAPGSPNFAILSFKSGFHGRLLGSLSSSRTKAVHKVDIPAFDWPAAEPPRYKYPLKENEDYNKA